MHSDSIRKLAAIMFTDIVGFTEQMGKDEDAALTLLEKKRRITSPLISKFDGELLKEMGDGLLITFPSAVKAANCAIEFQNALKNETELSIRIGIHIGDVVQKGRDVFGDGVNIASRIESLAETGGIAVSEKVFDDVRNKKNIYSSYLGYKNLKGVDRPIAIYAISSDPSSLPESVPYDGFTPKKSSLGKIPFLIAGLVLGLIITVFALRNSDMDQSIFNVNSLAIFNFENLSNGNSDRMGQIIQELVIADLSGIDGFKVFSSQRLFDIQKQMGIDSRMIDQSIALNVAKMAGAVHMITGNIIEGVEQQILTANILNVDDGSILKSRQVRGQDIFAMVDDLTALVKNDIDLKRADRILDVNVKEKTTSNMEAYNHYLEGVDLLYQSLFDKSISSFNKAISLDPNFKQAYFKLADTQLWAYYFNESHETLEQLSKLPNLTENDQQIIQGIEYLIREENEKAETIYQTLVNKESDNKEYWYSLGESIYHGRANMLEALDAFENAVNLDPGFALSYVHIFDIYLNRELFNRGFNKVEKYIELFPQAANGYIFRCQYNIALGNRDGAESDIEIAQNIDPENHMLTVPLLYLEKFQDAEKLANYHLTQKLSEGTEFDGKITMGAIRLMQGQVKEGISYYEEALSFDNPYLKPLSTMAVWIIVETYISQNQPERARKYVAELKKWIDDNDHHTILLIDYFNVIVASSEKDADMVNQFILKMKQRLDSYPGIKSVDNYIYYAGLAWESWLNKEPLKALEKISQVQDSKQWKTSLYNLEALCYLETKQYDLAIEIGEKMSSVKSYWELFPITYANGFYIKGLAYEALGRISDAIQEFETLSAHWKNADLKIPMLLDSKKRLITLKKTS